MPCVAAAHGPGASSAKSSRGGGAPGAPEAANASNITTDAWGSTGHGGIQEPALTKRRPEKKPRQRARESQARTRAESAENCAETAGASCFLVDTYGAKATFRVPVGAVAQLGERCVRNAEVRGSIPLSSTKTAVPQQNRRLRFVSSNRRRPRATSLIGLRRSRRSCEASPRKLHGPSRSVVPPSSDADRHGLRRRAGLR